MITASRELVSTFGSSLSKYSKYWLRILYVTIAGSSYTNSWF